MTLTHLCTFGLGLLAGLILKLKAITEGIEETEMSNKFISVLDDIGHGLKKFFTSPTVESIESTGASIAELAWPAATPLLSAIQKAIAMAQAQASTASTAGLNQSQMTAQVLAMIQADFNTYQAATGVTIETAQQEAIVQKALDLLAAIPAAPASAAAPAAAAPVPVVQAAAIPAAPVAGAAPTPGPGLSNVVPQ